MYFIDECGTKIEIVETYENKVGGYKFTHPKFGNAYLDEKSFIDLVESGDIKVICDYPDDDEEVCQCDYCCGVRDGVELAMNTMEELDALEDENEEFVDDIRGELFALKEEMIALRDEGLYEEYAHVANAYSMLYRLIM